MQELKRRKSLFLFPRRLAASRDTAILRCPAGTVARQHKEKALAELVRRALSIYNQEMELYSSATALSGSLLFSISALVGPPIVIGNDTTTGRRQLIPILSGALRGIGGQAAGLRGIILPGGIDSQVIRPDGRCELSARYGIRLDDGGSIYIENNGIRTVPDEYVETVKAGGFIDPSLYYFRSVPRFEVFDERLRWLTKRLIVCIATRLPDQVLLDYHEVL